MASIVGSKKRLKDWEECTSEAMELLEFGCDEILDLPQKKKYMMDAERRLNWRIKSKQGPQRGPLVWHIYERLPQQMSKTCA